MAKQIINNGTFDNDPSAEKIRESFDKCKNNFDELYLLAESTNNVVIQNPARLVFSALNTWYSNAQLVNQSWLTGQWTRTSGTGTAPNRSGLNFQNTNAFYIKNKTNLLSMDFYIRTSGLSTDLEFFVYAYDFDVNDGNESNEQILVNESFNVTNANSVKHNFTINNHTLSSDSIIQVFARSSIQTGFLDNVFLTYNFK